ncbi:hypothetical protein [Hymenobacter sp. DG01]|uniref:hypothetical protein n=1 Tax=Hymenobacter sp. DG01 TaxID=2584940 RepID=UPI00111DA60F|nr:hypothetical protein [Hymenobacter sp. DG01]
MKINLLLFWCCLSSYSFADEWPELQKKRYYSSNRAYFADVIPANRATACYVKVYENRAKGVALKWQRNLLNKEAPASAVVAPDGSSIIALDNWGSVGRGANVFVAYGPKGMLGRSYSLKDFSPFPISSFPRSASSTVWACGVEYVNSKRVRICVTPELNPEVAATKKILFYNLLTMRFE